MSAAKPAAQPVPAGAPETGTAAPAIPANDAGTAPPPIPPKRHHGDWQAGARLLAEGRNEQEVAEALGTTIAKVRRNLRESGRLRRWIEEERQTLQELASLRLDGVRQEVYDRMIAAMRKDDQRALLQLARHFGKEQGDRFPVTFPEYRLHMDVRYGAPRKDIEPTN